MKEFLEKLKRKENLSFEESKSAFTILMNGEAKETVVRAILSSHFEVEVSIFREGQHTYLFQMLLMCFGGKKITVSFNFSLCLKSTLRI